MRADADSSVDAYELSRGGMCRFKHGRLEHNYTPKIT